MKFENHITLQIEEQVSTFQCGIQYLMHCALLYTLHFSKCSRILDIAEL